MIDRRPLEEFVLTGEVRVPREGEWFASKMQPGFALQVGTYRPDAPREILVLRPAEAPATIDRGEPPWESWLSFYRFLAGYESMMEEDPPEQVFPTGSGDRKDLPVVTGVLDYFSGALAAVAAVSKYGNDKHNPGEDLHWSRGKSNDHADAIGRHLIDRGLIDPESGLRHSAELAWRSLALLQQELEEAGETPVSRGSR